MKLSWDGDAVGKIPIDYSNIWAGSSAEVKIPDGINSVYLTYRGSGSAALRSFRMT